MTLVFFDIALPHIEQIKRWFWDTYTVRIKRNDAVYFALTTTVIDIGDVSRISPLSLSMGYKNAYVVIPPDVWVKIHKTLNIDRKYIPPALVTALIIERARTLPKGYEPVTAAIKRQRTKYKDYTKFVAKIAMDDVEAFKSSTLK